MFMLDEYLDLESLLTKLQGKIKNQWYHFGLAIGVPNNALDQLYSHSEDDCLVEVLDYWLKNHPDQPTWKELADAVADLQDYELANSILKVYSEKGKGDIRVMRVQHLYQKKPPLFQLASCQTNYNIISLSPSFFDRLEISINFPSTESKCDKMLPPPPKYSNV